MTAANARLRQALDTPGGEKVAPIYDPLSARIAEMVGWEVCKLSGSVGKFANLAVPDGVPMTNNSDLVDVIRRIKRAAPSISLVIDGDDGGSALTLLRSIRELEEAGMSGIELEDNTVPSRFISERHALMVDKDEHVAKLRAALAARQDPSTVIIGRTTALYLEPLPQALDRISAYAATGVDAICLPGLGAKGISPNPRTDIEAVAEAAGLPLCISGLPRELADDHDWLAKNRVGLRYNAQVSYRAAVKAIYDGLTYLKDGPWEDLKDGWPSADVLARVTRTDELRAFDAEYGFGDA
jgi:oxaloacetate decarboxylase